MKIPFQNRFWKSKYNSMEIQKPTILKRNKLQFQQFNSDRFLDLMIETILCII